MFSGFMRKLEIGCFILLGFAFFSGASANAQTGIELLVNRITNGNQFFSDAATLSNGNVVFVWTDNSQSPDYENGSVVRAQILSPNGGLLANDILVVSSSEGNHGSPRVAALKPTNEVGGGFVIVWSDSNQLGSNVRARRFNEAGKPLVDDFIVNTFTYHRQTRPDVAALENGGFVVVWEDWSGTTSKGMKDDTYNGAVRAQIFDQIGERVNENFLVNTTTKGSQEHADIASLPDGGFFVVWQDLRSFYDGFEIWGQRFDKDGAKVGGELHINKAPYGADTDPSVTSFEDGGVAVAWTKGQPWIVGDFKPMLRFFDASGTPLTDELLLHSNYPSTSSGRYSLKTSLTTLPNGDLFAVSHGILEGSPDTSETSIWARTFSTGGAPKGDSFMVNATTNLHQYNPSATPLKDRRVAIGWTDSSKSSDDPSGDAVRACIVDPNLTQACILKPLTPAEALDKLIVSITELGLPKGVEGSLTAPLGQASTLLSDNNENNDISACGKLDAFINQVIAKSKNGQLNQIQADQLNDAATNIKVSLGC